MPNEKNLNRLNALLDAFDSGAVQPEELIEAIDAVMAVLESSQKAAFEKIETTDKKSESELNKVKADVSNKMEVVKASLIELNNTKATKTEIEKAHAGFAKEIERIEALIPTLPDEFDATDIYEVLEEQKEVISSLSELILGENIRNALEALPEGEKLAIEAIEGLREELDRRVQNAQQTTAIVARKLYQFTDITNASTAIDGQVLTANGDGTYTFETPTGGSGGGHIIQDEGAPLTQRANLNFVGAGVTATDDAGSDTTIVTIPGGGGGGGSTTNNYTDGLKDDQEFTPSANAASEVFTLSGTQEVVRVALEGVILEASEWSQAGANLTVTPVAGLQTSDTVTVVQRAENFAGELFTLSQTAAPSPANGTAVQWVANGSGTKDGTAYDEADVMITSVSQAGVSKTWKFDHSAA